MSFLTRYSNFDSSIRIGAVEQAPQATEYFLKKISMPSFLMTNPSMALSRSVFVLISSSASILPYFDFSFDRTSFTNSSVLFTSITSKSESLVIVPSSLNTMLNPPTSSRRVRRLYKSNSRFLRKRIWACLYKLLFRRKLRIECVWFRGRVWLRLFRRQFPFSIRRISCAAFRLLSDAPRNLL